MNINEQAAPNEPVNVPTNQKPETSEPTQAMTEEEIPSAKTEETPSVKLDALSPVEETPSVKLDELSPIEEPPSNIEGAAKRTNSLQSTPSIIINPARHAPPGSRLWLLLRISLIVLSVCLIPQLFFQPTAPLTYSEPQTAQISPAVTTPANASTDPNSPDLIPHIQSTSHERYQQLARQYVANMSLDEELGQLIMVEYNDTSYSNDLNTMLTTLHAGGVIMYEFQMLSQSQTTQDITRMQQNAKIPLLISTDEEGGPYVHRLTNIYPPRISATDIFNTGDPAVATREGHHVAQDLLSLGINTNLAPDVDINLINGYDMISRTFGSTSDEVIKFAGPYMQAMQSDGIIATIKHFPGLGAASIDAHIGLPVIDRTRDEIYSVELQPFKHFIQSTDPLEQPGIVMPTDLLMPAIDPVMPAELSHIFMTDILRNELGYDGVALTDALYMQGVKINDQSVDLAQASVMAIAAGDDMLLGPIGADEMRTVIQALKTALQNGTLTQSRINEAATRILTLKLERHLMRAIPPQN